MVNVAVVLSGCGYLDGSEIREAVLALYHLDRLGAEVTVIAPDMAQAEVVNHQTGESVDERRNVLVESARIARGNVLPLAEAKAGDFDALILPGGFGAAKNLSNLASKGAQASVLPELRDFIFGFLKDAKPIGAICISPAVLVAAVKDKAYLTVTIGEDEATAQVIAALGSKHERQPTTGMAYDREHRIASCSAYMREDRLSAIGEGIEKVVAQVMADVQAG